MTRDLILIRHTKSSWSDFSIPDFERPLKKDRIEDAKNMASKLKQLKLKPEHLICSPATRTRQTVEYFCDKLNYAYNKIQFDERIYESSAEEILSVVREIEPVIKTLVVVGHNPSLTHLANYFLENKIDEMPTTGVVWIEFKAANWEIYKPVACKLKYFLTPKTI